MIVLFFGAVLLGLPVSFAMLLATLIYLQFTDAAPPIAVPQNMVDGTGNFILLALPFFIFAGLIMERGGISVRLVRFAMALVGNVRGGAAAGDGGDHLPGQRHFRLEDRRRRRGRLGDARRDAPARLPRRSRGRRCWRPRRRWRRRSRPASPCWCWAR